MNIADVAIIGAGPAGLSTAIQLKRYALTPLVFEANEIGGLLNNANLVENYPGFPGGITGPELVQRFKDQAHHTQVNIISANVEELAWIENHFLLRTQSRSYYAQIVVIASGTKPNRLTSPSVPSQLHDLIYYEVYPLLDKHEKRFVIIGGGDAAFDYALNLSKANEVVILNRSSVTKCLPLLWQRAAATPRIEYIPNSMISGIEATQPGKIRINYKVPTGNHHIISDYLVCAIGREAKLDFILPRTLQILPDLVNQKKLFLAGDVNNGINRQTSIAVGDGVLAAMKIYRRVKEKFG